MRAPPEVEVLEARARLERAQQALQARLWALPRPQTLATVESWHRVLWAVSDAQEALDRALAQGR